MKALCFTLGSPSSAENGNTHLTPLHPSFSSNDLRLSCRHSTPTSGNLKARPGAEKQKGLATKTPLSRSGRRREGGIVYFCPAGQRKWCSKPQSHRSLTERAGFVSFLSRLVAGLGLQPKFLEPWSFPNIVLKESDSRRAK